jgi:hypothetical protein
MCVNGDVCDDRVRVRHSSKMKAKKATVSAAVSVRVCLTHTHTHARAHADNGAVFVTPVSPSAGNVDVTSQALAASSTSANGALPQFPTAEMSDELVV